MRPVHIRPAGCRRGRRVGHLAGVRGRNPDPVDIHLELVRDDLRDLDEQALAHLGTAMVQVDRPVGIDIDQRPGLVQVCRGKRNTEFDRGKCDTALQHGVRGIEVGDLPPSCTVIRTLCQVRNDVVYDVVFDLLQVRRRVALSHAVEIEAPHFQRILSEVTGDILQDVFDTEHALRAAEAAERRVRDRIGFHAMRDDGNVVEVISVVAVKHRPVVDRAGQVGGHAATGSEHELDSLDRAPIVEADLVLNQEIVALAGHQHVDVAVEA